VYTVIPSDKPEIVFSAGGDGMIVQWDLSKPQEGELIARLPNSVYAMHYLPETESLVVGHNYDGIHLLAVREKKEIRSLKLSSAAVFDIQSFGSDLLVALGDGQVAIVDNEQWVIKRKLSFAAKNARVIAINPLLGEAAIGYSDHYIRIFSLDDFALKSEFKAHQNSVFTLRYTPDNQILLSGSRDAHVKAWDVSSKYTQAGDIAAHLFAINHISFSPDGNYFATGSMDKTIKVWDTNELKLLKVIDKARHGGHGNSVNKLHWTSFDNQLVSASDDRSLSLWSIKFNA